MKRQKQAWNGRELLGKLTETPGERKRVAALLGVHPTTIQRWVDNKANPKVDQLRQLLDIFPEYSKIFLESISSYVAPNAPKVSSEEETLEPSVPEAFLAKMLAAYAETTGLYRAWTIRHMGLQQACRILDPDFIGMEMSIIQCVRPQASHPVRSLCECMAMGSASPWKNKAERKLLFLGAESLAGWVVGRGEPGVVNDLERDDELLPFRKWPHEKSACAYPLRRKGEIAGCLLLGCTQKDYFTEERLKHVGIYANAFALSFEDEEFFPPSTIRLHCMPVLSPEEQQAQNTRFRERVLAIRREHEFYFSEQDAEIRALQEIESCLINKLEGM